MVQTRSTFVQEYRHLRLLATGQTIPSSSHSNHLQPYHNELHFHAMFHVVKGVFSGRVNLHVIERVDRSVPLEHAVSVFFGRGMAIKFELPTHKTCRISGYTYMGNLGPSCLFELTRDSK